MNLQKRRTDGENKVPTLNQYVTTVDSLLTDAIPCQTGDHPTAYRLKEQQHPKAQ